MNWQPAAVRDHVIRLCRERGLGDGGELVLLRWGNNISFRHGKAGIVFRVASDGAPRVPFERETRVARFLALSGFPAPRLSALWPDQPILVGGAQITAWQWVPGREGGSSDYCELGFLLARLHALSPPEGLVEEAGCVERSFDRLAGLAREAEKYRCSAEFEFLRDALLEQVTGPSSPLRITASRGVLVHGDAHPGNIVVTPSGGSVLLDFEYAGIAVPEWDLSEPLLHVTRFGMPASCWTKLRAAYGADRIDDDLLLAMTRVREVKLAAWSMDRALRTGDCLGEALRRARSLHDADPDVRWSPI
ncbi:aminoglycoside phosphotransferase family protein [Amycolatopsis sp. DG1A-15b]|uniref:aminoglycoside phosphotransferase family protein n=1 Tax=Amycolatopsis sp. DG1A-15b TaxID=3052846 RepID=UPI00255B785B|nr:aminoglycoside phosphotransferase family protein [Amycolatopsis sp. DG1A-15b]WIX85825.1 aminoglycoside phosphotransferase family protein [Amycolatopsis sp. DG1A-15b]